MKKETVIRLLDSLPEEFELDLLIEKLIFVEKVERGLRDLKNGNTLTHERVLEKIKQW